MAHRLPSRQFDLSAAAACAIPDVYAPSQSDDLAVARSSAPAGAGGIVRLPEHPPIRTAVRKATPCDRGLGAVTGIPKRHSTLQV